MNENNEPLAALKKDQDHLLKRLEAVERLSEFLGMAPEDAFGLPLLAQQIKALENDLECHAQKEEQSLFSLLIDMEEDQGSEFVVPLITEHCDLERNCDELKGAVETLGFQEGESRHWQVLKIIEKIRDLSELLRDHLQTELKKLFPHILTMLDPSETALATEQMEWIQTRYPSL